MEKEFKTIEEQIEILKRRNLVIDDEKAKEIFKENNYYYLINGYKDLFVTCENGIEKYKDNVTLEEIYSLYNFDSELRINFLRYILKIERRLDTYIAYEFSKQYGHKNYLIEDNFNNNKRNPLTNFNITNLISEIRYDMTKQIEVGNKMLNHYMNKYGYIPLWVLVRILTFGKISKFYDLMKQKEQNAVAKNFKIRENVLKTYIHNLAIVRNICAHDEKLYDFKFRNAIVQNKYHINYKLNLNDLSKSNGYKDLFSIVIILKMMLKKDEFEQFYNIIIQELSILEFNIKSISYELILNKMGFPVNYKELLEM